jgi:hypothetical protein
MEARLPGHAVHRHLGLDVDESAQDPTDHLLERALQTPLSARTTDPSADQFGQREPYRCASFEGFSLHANVAVQAHDREGLLRLCRYGARQAFSQKQLSELPDGRLRYALKRPWGPQGARELVLDPTELLHRLALLLPKPYLNPLLKKSSQPLASWICSTGSTSARS